MAVSQAADFEVVDRADTYRLVSYTLRRFGYRRCSRTDKGLLRRYLMTVIGLSRAQITRLIGQYRQAGRVRDRRGAPVRPFARRTTHVDVAALADLDRAHGQLSGHATRKLCECAWHVFSEARYERLAGISNGHLYNLRHSTGYRRQRGHVAKTQATRVAIAERRRPEPNGQPGYLRVDSVHQGDLDGINLHVFDRKTL